MIIEENEDVLKALKRLPPKEAYDRVYRIRRALQCSVSHKLLPKGQWTKPEEVCIADPTTGKKGKKKKKERIRPLIIEMPKLQDVPYLTPILEQIRAAEAEKAALDTLVVVKNH